MNVEREMSTESARFGVFSTAATLKDFAPKSSHEPTPGCSRVLSADSIHSQGVGARALLPIAEQLKAEIESEFPAAKSECVNCDQTALSIVEWMDRLELIVSQRIRWQLPRARTEIEAVIQSMRETAKMYLDLESI